MKTRLQELRKASGFRSAKAFAESYGINLNTYTGYEQGKPMSLEQAWEFADFFDCSLDDLVGRKRPAKKYADEQQAQLNADYEYLDEAGKAAAANAVRGIASGYAREKTGTEGPEAARVRTA